AHPVALARLLNAAVALGLLEKHDDRYANSPIAAACLAGEGPFYLGNLVKREGAFYRRWSRLTEAVRTGQRPEENIKDEDQSNWVRDFELALYDIARTAAPAIAEALQPLLPQRSGRPLRVIDIGGGHGAYSIALARRDSNMEAVVFELPAVTEVAREIVATSGVADRVAVQAGDFKTDDLGTNFDLALLFGILVSEPPADAVALLRKIHAALGPGGLVAIRGFYLAPDRAGPLEATLSDLHMLLSTDAGTAHTVDDVAAWLHEAGFLPPETVALPVPERSNLLVSRKSVA
ncbi:MAG: acetylserotonin O-methyltransferase, partial [Chloroflexota bacterium]|nr:acetylserotonin O-methyltransferase [Chloroflexota bacterium]